MHGTQGKIRLYYGLTNFYQNHREYVDSRDDKQLLGEMFTSGDNAVEPSPDCEPLHKGVYYAADINTNSTYLVWTYCT